jgi:hypothetical protein
MGPWPRGHQPWSSIILDRASPMSSARHNASTSRPSPPPLLTIAPRVATERQASRPLTRNAVHGFRLGRLCVRLASGPGERPTSFADDRTNRASRALHHAPATFADSGPSTIRGPIAPCGQARCVLSETAHSQPLAYARVANSACASAISGICDVGAKPSSAGVRTAWASSGRPVD